MNQDYLLPTNDIREIKDLYLEPIDLINNGQCTAYYAVVIYVEDEIIYIENKKISSNPRFFKEIQSLLNCVFLAFCFMFYWLLSLA